MKRLKRTIKYHINKSARKRKLLNQTKKNKNVIYGARSIKKQIGIFGRDTFDYDILAKNPKQAAKRTTKTFNKISGAKNYYAKPAIHPGTHKVMFIGADGKKYTRDNVGLVDYSKYPKPKPKHITIGQIRYRNLLQEEQAKKKALADKTQQFRHPKDRDDLNRIQTFNKLKRLMKS